MHPDIFSDIVHSIERMCSVSRENRGLRQQTESSFWMVYAFYKWVELLFLDVAPGRREKIATFSSTESQQRTPPTVDGFEQERLKSASERA